MRVGQGPGCGGWGDAGYLGIKRDLCPRVGIDHEWSCHSLGLGSLGSE